MANNSFTSWQRHAISAGLQAIWIFTATFVAVPRSAFYIGHMA